MAEQDENYHIAQLSKQFRNLKETCLAQQEEIQSLREIVRAINIKAGNSAEDYYAWMPFEENHIETLSLDCPVLIPSGWLVQLLKEHQTAYKDAVDVIEDLEFFLQHSEDTEEALKRLRGFLNKHKGATK